MEITIYSKKRTNRDGKAFYSYITTLTRKDGSTQTVGVKFRDECGHPKPENCPMNIRVDKENANISKSTYTREDTGETAVSYTMWIAAWESGTPWVDKSLDEFDV